MNGELILLIGAVGLLGLNSVLNDWQLSRRIARIERARTRAAASPELARIWRSVAFTEQRETAEEALMTMIASEPPEKLYRRVGRRYVSVDPAA